MQSELPKGSGVWLTTEQLAKRWSIAPKTIRNWRSRKVGPRYVKGGFGRHRVLYQLVEIEQIEIERFGKSLEAG